MTALAAILRWSLAASVLALMAGCTGYSAIRSGIDAHIAAGQPLQALELMEQRPPADRDRVVYLLDKALLLRQANRFADSNAALEQAKALIDELEALSLREEGSAFVVNDGIRSYVGEPFEQALLHVYAALNYLDLGDPGAARVEVLQVEQRLRTLVEDEGPFARDPMAFYLAGVIYEIQGETSDALIAYRKALEALDAHRERYGVAVPGALRSVMLRLTEGLGLDDEHERLAKRFGTVEIETPGAGEGELVVLFHNGLAPIKREQVTLIYPPRAPRLVAVALPFFENRAADAARLRVRVGERSAISDTLEDVSAIARQTLADALPAVTGRAILRAVAKYQIANRAQQDNGPLAGVAANLAGLLTERADTRSWLTLPGEIQVARLAVPAGTSSVTLEVLDAGDGILASETRTVVVPVGRPAVVSVRRIPPVQPRRH